MTESINGVIGPKESTNEEGSTTWQTKIFVHGVVNLSSQNGDSTRQMFRYGTT